uniref:Uncharacterized protein n=1 Tax=Kalanchoe fedtschenkoi TaxID=63787 RepID=A0A7N0UD98_KALFE
MEVACRASLVPQRGAEPSDRRKPCLVASVNVGNHGWKSGDLEVGIGSHRQLAGRRLTVTCGEKKERKEKRKLVKGLKKDLEMFAEMGFGIDPRSGLAGKVQGSVMAEAAEVLLRQLQSLREAEEEEARRKKQEKKQKSRAVQTLELEDVAVEVESSTDSGDGRVESSSTDFNSSWKEQALSSTAAGRECSPAEAVARVLRHSRDQVENEERFGCGISLQVQEVLTRLPAIEFNAAQPVIPASPSEQESAHQLTARPETGTKKVEICMGGKCKKSGGSQLLERFQRLAESEDGVSVAGCKCMGRCKNGPNVRLSTSNAAPGICSGVEMGDADALLSSFLELE